MTNQSNGNLFQQNTDLEIVELFLPFLTHKQFLDIGAEKGEFTRFFANHGLKGVFFEPLPQCVEELTQLARETGCTFSSFAVDAMDRTADFYHAFDKDNQDAQHFSSLHPLQNDERITHKKVSTVQCRSLDSLLREGFIPEHLGVIKIDTEGNDLNVLKGMTKVSADVLMCEYFMPKIYAGWELGHPLGLIKKAKELGFNHYFAIKRIYFLETVSFDNDDFIDEQWGNLIFISDQLFNRTEKVISQYLSRKKEEFFASVLDKFIQVEKTCKEQAREMNLLRQACKEREQALEAQQKEMDMLHQVCQERLDLIEKLSKELA